jgi:lysozyme
MADPDNALNIAASQLTEPAEGYVLHPYRDPAGVWTIGVGSTRDMNGRPVTAQTQRITSVEAMQLLERDLRSALQAVQAAVRVPLSDDEEAALIDFIYNVGAGAFDASTLLRKLNAGDYEGAADQFQLWDLAGGRVLAGLCRRRAAEKAEFLKPDATPPAVPITPPG